MSALGLGEETDIFELRDPLPIELLLIDSWQFIRLDRPVAYFLTETDFLVS